VYGTAPVTIGAGHIALRDKEGAIQTSSGGALTFSGRPTMTIPAGAVVYSDPVNLTVPQMADLAIDLYLPGSTNTATMFTMHNGAFQTNYISETGNHVGKVTLSSASKIQNWFLLSRFEVVSPEAIGAVVVRAMLVTRRWPTRSICRCSGNGNRETVKCTEDSGGTCPDRRGSAPTVARIPGERHRTGGRRTKITLAASRSPATPHPILLR
jgi:hypothetical protein